jgi:hypothetical protein
MAYVTYLDESYADDSPVFAVAGYIFTVENARLIEDEWKGVLERYGVPYFHMADVNACKGVFEPLGESGCDQMARETIALLQKYVSIGVVAIGTKKLANAPIIKDDVYTLCLIEVMRCCITWVQHFDPYAEIEFIFESGHPTCGMAWDILNKRPYIYQNNTPDPRIGPIISDSKEKRSLLQAADVLAWQATKYVKGMVKGNKRPRGDFRALTELKHLFLYHHFKTDSYEQFKDPAPNQPQVRRDDFLRMMFQLPKDWRPRRPGISLRHTIDFGEDLKPKHPSDDVPYSRPSTPKPP